MPICEITYPIGFLSVQEQDRIAERLCPLLLEAEGLPDTPAAKALCLINMTEATRVYLGGKPTGQGKIVVKIHAFADAYTDAAKTALYRDITRIFCEENAASKAVGGGNVWCLILALETGNFGAAGMPVSLEMARSLAAAASS